MTFCFSAGIPMPVSETSNATTAGACLSTGCSGLQPLWTDETLRRTPPCAVNLNAFDSRFLSTCCSRLESVVMMRPRLESRLTSNASCRVSASWRKGRAIMSRRFANAISSASTVTVPDSIFDKSRISLIRFKRSVPAP
jgi:hypothetical protein